MRCEFRVGMGVGWKAWRRSLSPVSVTPISEMTLGDAIILAMTRGMTHKVDYVIGGFKSWEIRPVTHNHLTRV